MACAVEPALEPGLDLAARPGPARTEWDHARELLELCGILDGPPEDEFPACSCLSRTRLCRADDHVCAVEAPAAKQDPAPCVKRELVVKQEPVDPEAPCVKREPVVKQEPADPEAPRGRKRAASRSAKRGPSAVKRRRSRSAPPAPPAGAKPFACQEPGCRKRFEEEWMLVRHASAHA